MSFTDRHIVDSYATLLDGLDAESKTELIERLSKSLKTERKKNERAFFRSFGAFASSKPAEQIISDIRLSRKFRKKEFKF
jgi:hypothetical protein